MKKLFIGGLLAIIAIVCAMAWEQPEPPVVIRGFAPQTKASGVLKGTEVELPSPKDDAPEWKPSFYPAITDIAFPPIPEKSGKVGKPKKVMEAKKDAPRAEHAAPNATRHLVREVERKFGGHIRMVASRHGRDWREILGVVVIESGGDPNAVSKAGARGLPQLLGSAIKDTGKKIDPHHHWDSLWAGTAYLNILRDRYGYRTLEEQLVAYNMGPAAAQKYLGGNSPNEYFYVRRYKKVMSEVTWLYGPTS